MVSLISFYSHGDKDFQLVEGFFFFFFSKPDYVGCRLDMKKDFTVYWTVFDAIKATKEPETTILSSAEKHGHVFGGDRIEAICTAVKWQGFFFFLLTETVWSFVPLWTHEDSIIVKSNPVDCRSDQEGLCIFQSSHFVL